MGQAYVNILVHKGYVSSTVRDGYASFSKSHIK